MPGMSNQAFKTLIDIVKPVNIEKYTTAKICLFILTLGANLFISTLVANSPGPFSCNLCCLRILYCIIKFIDTLINKTCCDNIIDIY